MSLDKSQWGYEEGNPFHSVVETELTDNRTLIEIYWETEGELPEYVEQAIVFLERENKRYRAENGNLNDKLRFKNQALKEMLGAMKESRPELRYFIGELDKIINL